MSDNLRVLDFLCNKCLALSERRKGDMRIEEMCASCYRKLCDYLMRNWCKQ